MELLQSYLKIQQMRFRDSVQVEYEIAREVLTYRTIKLLLQPLVENAIHHARKEEEVLHIAVRIQKEERDVVFQVTDDGCGIEAEKLIKTAKFSAALRGRIWTEKCCKQGSSGLWRELWCPNRKPGRIWNDSFCQNSSKRIKNQQKQK